MRAVVKAHKRTREIVAMYESIASAAYENGVNAGAIFQNCRNRTLQKGELYYRFADEFDPSEDFTGRENCPVIVTDATSGFSTWFPSRRACAEALHVGIRQVHVAAKYESRLLWRYLIRNAGKGIS